MNELRTYDEDYMGNITVSTPCGTVFIQGDDASDLLRELEKIENFTYPNKTYKTVEEAIDCYLESYDDICE